MAEGRMLKNKISVDVEVADLKNDTHRLLFTWGISHLDVAGRISGNPREFKAKVVPMLDHITQEIILQFIDDAQSLGLIQRFFAEGKWVIQYPGFTKNQSLREHKEAPSAYPAPVLPDAILHKARITPGIIPDKDGSTPGVILDKDGSTPGVILDKDGSTPAEEKGREEKGREEKGREGKGRVTPPDGGASTAYSCQHFDITKDHFADILREFPQFPKEYLLIEFFPRMRDWCADNLMDSKHKKKFKGLALRNIRACFRNWLKTEDTEKVGPYRYPKITTVFNDPPGMQTVFNPVCPDCRGSGFYRDGPCACGKLEPVVDPDLECSKCNGKGITKDGVCDCFKARIHEAPRKTTNTETRPT